MLGLLYTFAQQELVEIQKSVVLYKQSEMLLRTNVCAFRDRYLVSLNAIKPMCDLLTVMDSKIVQVSLNGLENILRLGEQEAKQNGTGINPYCALIEEAYGNARKPPTEHSPAFIHSEKWTRSFVSRLVPHPPSVHCTSVGLLLSRHLFVTERARACLQERLSFKKCQKWKLCLGSVYVRGEGKVWTF